ncbi:hypothetical protein D6777_02585 [Candidatus Woesearchaeota archaeon]|nr:MAG: hypothetical protein D6777_02585 [Candidatus Woesearchaeota archaeon]
MKHKRGQEAADGVYILLILMGLFIVLYVVLLPPADRESLLNETTSTLTTGAPAKTVLLSESPGMVYSSSVKKQTINIEPVHLYSTDEVQSSMLVKSMSVSRNLLKNNFKNVLFSVDDLDNLKKAEILFFITESKGDLKVYLNNKLIYDGKLTSEQLPLTLPLEYLQKNNKLKFESTSPGMRIFSSNYYLIKDLTLLKTIKKENKKSSRTFSVAEDVGQNVNSITLNYQINCNEDTNPKLKIMVNSRNVFEDIVSCSYLQERQVTLTKSEVNVYGRNRVEFEINKGDIEINDIKLNMKLRSSMHPSYSFDISNGVWNNINNGDSKVVLRLTLKGEGRKKANIIVQGETFSIDTNSGTYVRDITSLVDNGANTIKIVPLNDFEIVNLKVAEE